MQERRNSIANALELRISCISENNPNRNNDMLPSDITVRE